MGRTSPGWSNDRLIFDSFLFLVALVFFIYSFELNLRSWFFPGVSSIILLTMVGTQIVMDLYRSRSPFKGGDNPSHGEENGSSLRKRYARLWAVILSIIVFYLLFRFVTIYVAIPVLCVLMLRFLGKRPWLTVGLVSVSVDLFVYGFFQLVLNTAL